MSSLLPSSSPFLFIKVGVIQRIQSKVMDRMCSVPQSSLTLVTPGTVAHQAPLSMGFSRQGYWSGVPFLPPGDLPDPGTDPGSPPLQADSLPYEPPGKPMVIQLKRNQLGSDSNSSGPSDPHMPSFRWAHDQRKEPWLCECLRGARNL